MVKEAACVFIRNEEGKILVVSRKDNCHEFGLPGGKVDPGETLEQAAKREAVEETGYQVINLVPFYYREASDFNCTTFAAEINTEVERLELDPKESGVVDWVSPEVLKSGPFGNYNTDMLLAYEIYKT